MGKLVALAIGTLVLTTLLASCAPPKSVSSPQPTSSLSQTAIETATEAQVLAVLDKYRSDLTAVVDGTSKCRQLWSAKSSGAEGAACYVRELQVGVTGQLLLREWNEMAVPASLSTLVEDTGQVITRIGAIDLIMECGLGRVPSDEAGCAEALRERKALYTELDDKLQAWSRI